MNTKVQPLRLNSIEELHRLFFDVMGDGVLIVDRHGHIRDCNSVFHQRLGYEKHELLGMPVARLDPPAFAARVPERMADIMDVGHAMFETAHYRRDGSVMPVELHTRLAEIEGEPLMFSIVRDISQRKRAEEALERRERELVTIFDSSPIIVFSKDREGRFIRVNRVFADALQLPAEAFVGKTVFDLYSREIAEAMTVDDREVLDSGMPKLHIIEQYESKDGKRWVRTDKVPTRDGSGQVTGLVGFAQDITDYKLAEEQLRQSQKMEAVGTLVGGIAHDFNNMLGGITGNIYMARNSVAAMPAVVERLDNMERLCFRASHMIRQLLMFARRERLQLQPFGLISFLQEVSKLTAVTIRSSILFESHLCEQELVVKGDATQLHQALINLLNNAQDAVASVPEPRIAFRVTEFVADEGFRQRHPAMQGRRFARLTIEDNGCGLSEAVRERIFEPFYTTKEVGAGTGLGLSMVYGAVESHDGVIEVDSVPGEGACFHIYLPLAKGQEVIAECEEAAAALPGQGETILMVDDNVDVRSSIRAVLESLGYRVIEAADGVEAVELFADDGHTIDLVIMDVIMPRLGGVKAVERIRTTHPEVKVVFTTGYDMDKSLQEEMPPADQVVLFKPCSIGSLSQAIREQLQA